MAKIFAVRDGNNFRITLKGRLTASDLRRLERACGSSLEHRCTPLQLNVEHVLSMDSAARGYLDRLRARGARIEGDLNERPAGSRRGPGGGLDRDR